MPAGKSESPMLFLGKRDDAHCARAIDFVERNFAHVAIYLGAWGDPFPKEIDRWEGDYIISFLSRWVIPDRVLKKAKRAALNFHPASPDYPGIGCLNFALYEQSPDYGATCHHMIAEIDAGEIVAAKRFPVYPSDDVGSLLMRTYDFQLTMFYEVVGTMLAGEPLPKSDEKWTRKPLTRKEFNDLCVIDPSMDTEEVAKRVRATSFGKFQPTVNIAGHVFRLKTQHDA